eukprot:EG_transcript_8527
MAGPLWPGRPASSPAILGALSLTLVLAWLCRPLPGVGRAASLAVLPASAVAEWPVMEGQKAAPHALIGPRFSAVTGASPRLPKRLLPRAQLQHPSNRSSGAVSLALVGGFGVLVGWLGWLLLCHYRPTSSYATQPCYAMASVTAEEAAQPDERLAFAPMMEYTTRHFRFLARLLTKRSVLYTEMVAANVLLQRPDQVDRRLAFTDAPWAPPPGVADPPAVGPVTEHPVVLQLGGSSPELLERVCTLAAPYGYDALNLNCGCPSEAVADSGSFGAALMRNSALVSDLVLASRAGLAAGGRAGTPVTIKCRLGVDNGFADIDTTYENLAAFVATLSQGPAQVRRFQVHARKAVLGRRVTPTENRKVPLRYEWVSRLARDFPDVEFVLNGGVRSIPEVVQLMDPAGPHPGLRGVMCGRATIDNPWQFAVVDAAVYGDPATQPGLSRRQLLAVYGAYCDEQEEAARRDGYEGAPWRRTLLKPLQNLFFGEHHGRRWSVLLERAVQDEEHRSWPLSEFLAFAVASGLLEEEALDRLPGQPRPPPSWLSSGSDDDEPTQAVN